ncbi:hypothetical protein SCUCBS95973_009835 [Sporothrix curviconia]|uniref:alpha-L-rhamnosidase n=1 Tax=Sporothrix curviconia TaxID=1260050 RepID=A0ABP0CZX0_9PEZI
MPILTAPTAEQHATGLGIGTPTPRLSWRFVLGEADENDNDWTQSAYDIEVQRSNASSTPESYHVDSPDSVLVPWPSTPLQSRERAGVRVRAFSRAGKPTEWSAWTAVECGLLDRKDWTAVPITSAAVSPVASPDVPAALRPLRFRKVFSVADATVATVARLYITGLGVYRAFLNGTRIGDHEMAPGWTSYKHHLNYETFEVTHLLRPGNNVLAVEVAEGWYAGRLGFHGGMRRIYGEDIGVMAQLEVGQGDGDDSDDKRQTIVTDSSWQCSPSATLRAEIYDGEFYDMREETEWTTSSSSSSSTAEATWSPVRTMAPPTAELVSPSAPPVRVTQTVKPLAVITTPSGKTILDFGQNLVGRLRVQLGALASLPRSHQVVFTHAEVLEHGELGIRPLRIAACKDTLIVDGTTATGEWNPNYTFHGFRYAQVEGFAQDQDQDQGQIKDRLLASVVADVLHTDMVRTGHFACSHPKVNKLHENTVWSMRGNFLSIPTDCPQRDERLGWTGDIQVFCNSANFLYNTAGMLGDWLRDLRAEQLLDSDDGVPPVVVPDILQTLWPHAPLAVWDDVTVLAPWDLYRSYGDAGFLQRQYDSMVAWVDRGVPRGADGLWVSTAPQLGDWLDPAAPPDKPEETRTSGILVADAYLVRVTDVLAQASAVLGKTADAIRYTADAHRVRAAFQNKYLTPAGLLVGDSQTGLALAIVFDLFPSAQTRAFAAARLVELVRAARFRVATGFAGTPLITHALTRAGQPQMAYRMLLETRSPSWMYPILMGATTIWERWDSMLPDGRINPGEMTSFNHYSLGSVVHWLHGSVAGVRCLEAGWRTFAVSPVPGGALTSAEASYETAYGRVQSKWSISDGDKFVLDVLVPANTRALVILPHERSAATEEGQDGRVVDEGQGRWVGSGRHHYESQWSSTAAWPPAALPGLFDAKDEPDSIAAV